MREVMDELMAWWRAGESVGVGTVVATWRSAPRPAGASMLVGPGGEAVGSVSGGCVEGALYELNQEVRDERPAVAAALRGQRRRRVRRRTDLRRHPGRLRRDASTRDSFPELGDVAADIEAGRPVAVCTVIAHPDPAHVGRRLVVRPEDAVRAGPRHARVQRADAAVTDDVRGLLASGRTETLTYGPDGERRGEGMRVFVASYAPKPRMLVFGAIDFAAAVARVGSFLGYRVTVCDARPVFATRSRFPEADEVVVEWPHRYLAAEAGAGRVDGRTVLAVLTHDPKFDVPLLEVALRLDVAYVGAMGSRRTHEERLERLHEAGLTEAELGRLSSPIGLDLGARTPEETAVSIAAEIIQLRWGGRGRRLAELEGPIHHGATR